jgi:hypothetical protein
MMFFWVSAPCRFVGRFQRFEETYCLHLQGWSWRQYVSMKSWNLPASLHVVSKPRNVEETTVPFWFPTNLLLKFIPNELRVLSNRRKYHVFWPSIEPGHLSTTSDNITCVIAIRRSRLYAERQVGCGPYSPLKVVFMSS